MTEHAMSQEMEQCIQNCQDCHRICLETAIHCLGMGGKHAAQAHIRVLLDCAEICQASANFMIRGSEFHGATCGVCADVCTRCADECERIGPDEMMRRCIETCHRCAESCRAMAA